MESLASLSNRRRAPSGGAGRIGTAIGGQPGEELTLTTDNGTQFSSSRFLKTLGRLAITPSADGVPSSGRQQLHRTVAERRSLDEARASIARWIDEHNHDRPHRGIQNRTPLEAFLAFAGVLKNEALMPKLVGAIQILPFVGCRFMLDRELKSPAVVLTTQKKAD